MESCIGVFSFFTGFTKKHRIPQCCMLHREDLYCVLSSATKDLWMSPPEYLRYFPEVWESRGHCNTSLTSTSRHPLAASCILIHYSRPRLWVSMTQYPAAKLLGIPLCSSDTRWICISSYCDVCTVCSRSHTLYLFPPLCHVTPSNNQNIQLQGTVGYLSVGTLRVQMTTATPSPPPAVNFLLLDPNNHLPSVALLCNALPHGLITTTLFRL